MDLIFWVFLGIVAAVIQIILIRDPLKSIIVTGFFASLVGGYKFYLQPSFEVLPLLPEFFMVAFGAYLISKGLLTFARLFGIIPI